MKVGNIGSLTTKLSEIPRKFKQFITHDVRRNPILGLYLVIGLMVVGYGIYFVGIAYKDFSSGGDKRVASKSEVGKTKKAPAPKPAPTKKKKPPPNTAKKSSEQVTPPLSGSRTSKAPGNQKSATGQKLAVSNWNQFEFEDGSRIYFPADWSESEIPPEKNIIHGIRLRVPNTAASIKCYGRLRQPGIIVAESVKRIMRNGGYSKIKEEREEINNLDVVRLSGILADKHMVVSIFDDQPDKYFIVSLVASEKDYAKLQKYYGAVVNTYTSAKTQAGSVVSIKKIEQELEKSIEADKVYLVGTAVRIRLKNGSRHQGVVIAENDDSFVLESSRFGGTYSFTVKKKDIVELVR
jgi:hypothetical protein